MDLDVSYVRYPGLWHVWWEEGKCALGQSSVSVKFGMLLRLVDLMNFTFIFTFSDQCSREESYSGNFIKSTLAFVRTLTARFLLNAVRR